MKTSNKIPTIYGALFAVLIFGSLGLNIHKYSTSRPAMEQCVATLRDGKDSPVLVVDAGMTVYFHKQDYGSIMLFSRDATVPEVRISGDTLFVSGIRYIMAPNTVQQIVKGDDIVDVPPAGEWPRGEMGF